MDLNPFGLADDEEIVTVYDAKKFVIDCLLATNVPKPQAEISAEVIVEADCRGHRSHGFRRLSKFVAECRRGSVDVKAEPRIEKESDVTAWVDGRNALGPVIGTYCMKIAIQKAKDKGVSIVVAKRSNNIGIAGYYSSLALQEGLIGMAFTNGPALLSATRAKYSISGANPISISAAGEDGDSFILDMATTVVAPGRIAMLAAKGEYLPFGWALNAGCMLETDADVAYKTGRILPLGGLEISGGYKGTGLSVMVDILCGILSGSYYGTSVPIWSKRAALEPANLGQCFMVVNPAFFAEGFEFRLSDVMNHLRSMDPVDPGKPVLVAGDGCRANWERVEEVGGIIYHRRILDQCAKLSALLKIKDLEVVPRIMPKPEGSSEEFEIEEEEEYMMPEDEMAEDEILGELDSEMMGEESEYPLTSEELALKAFDTVDTEINSVAVTTTDPSVVTASEFTSATAD